MITKPLKSFPAIFCFLIFSICAYTQPVNTALLDQLMDSLSVHNKSMASVLMVKNGVKLYERAIGYAEVDSVHPRIATPATRYGIGSITKIFTATMIMQLIEEGKLTQDTKLQAFFPDLPHASRITIDMMLRHQSGLHNFTNDEAFWKTMTQPKTRAQVLAGYKAMKPDFEPGAQSVYSNTNYVLLGYIIEDITGKSYQKNLTKRITSRIGLKSTRLGGKIEPAKGDAFSYTFSDRWEKTPHTDPSLTAGAGAIVSTPEDLSIFIRALFDGKLVSRQSLAQMTTISGTFGAGLFRTPFYQKEGFGHTGLIDGYQSSLSYFPGDSLAVAVISNGVEYPVNDILVAMLKTYHKAPFILPNFQVTDVKPELLDRYTGVYSTPQMPVKFTVSRRNRTLMGQADADTPFVLTPFEIHKFKNDGLGLLIEFRPDEDKLVATQAEEVIEFTKGPK